MSDQKQRACRRRLGVTKVIISFLTRDARKMGESGFKEGRDGLAKIVAWLVATNGTVEASLIQVAIEVPCRFRDRFTWRAPRMLRASAFNRQLKQAHHQFGVLTTRLIPERGGDKPGGQWRSSHLAGVGRLVLATLLAEAFDGLQ
ncbi:hypothetical protein [Mesorhizobium sp. M7A.F.Ce.TU.012.03.2.1]|uniref:hypothetical protein n=1 Tax=Mesorhizobium sp. M7A.F.Ce.TU.012.03.2.1 TaxID=2493681 RepID=UPI001FE1B729|nr:hypothetical protein [Mesorhizobium sp. M7A.F.Ce.TU.012.03.2.1]